MLSKVSFTDVNQVQPHARSRVHNPGTENGFTVGGHLGFSPIGTLFGDAAVYIVAQVEVAVRPDNFVRQLNTLTPSIPLTLDRA